MVEEGIIHFSRVKVRVTAVNSAQLNAERSIIVKVIREMFNAIASSSVCSILICRHYCALRIKMTIATLACRFLPTWKVGYFLAMRAIASRAASSGDIPWRIDSTVWYVGRKRIITGTKLSSHTPIIEKDVIKDLIRRKKSPIP